MTWVEGTGSGGGSSSSSDRTGTGGGGPDDSFEVLDVPHPPHNRRSVTVEPSKIQRTWEPVCRALDAHPKYYEVFARQLQLLIYGDISRLSLADRHFIALMAASRHSCSFLVKLHSNELHRYSTTSHHREWLSRGLTAADERLQRLDALNTILAHKPWCVTAQHFHELLRSESGARIWPRDELMHALVIMTHTHALCSFVLAEQEQLTTPRQPSPPVAPQQQQSGPQVAAAATQAGGQTAAAAPVELGRLLQRMEELKSDGTASDPATDKHFLALLQQHPSGDGTEPLAQQQQQPQVAPSTPAPAPQVPPPQPAAAQQPTVVFTQDPTYGYQDFASRDLTKFRTFKIHDFDWDRRGYGFVAENCEPLAKTLEDKFNLTQNLTYRTLGNYYKDVDTSKYRTAVWMYIQSIFGVRHDDYDYHEVNLLLDRDTKTYIKTVCCFPDQLTEAQRASVLKSFRPSEKTHVVLLIMEARLQATLLYALRAWDECERALRREN